MKKTLTALFLLSCFACVAQGGSEIYLFDLTVKNGQLVISNGINITNHKGYDNQPFFHPTKPFIYYASFNDSARSDIKYYDYKNKTTHNLTTTNEREYSPTLTPDGKFISCIIQRDNGAQDLGKYPVDGGQPVVLISDLIVGYHTWVDDHKLLLFVLGDSNRHSLHYYDLKTKTDVVIAQNIGRSLHKIPGQNAMSFVQKITDSLSMISRFDPITTSTRELVSTLKGTDHLAWLKNNIVLMSDGSRVFSYRVGIDTSWWPLTIEGESSMLKGISRIATNADNTRLAVVVSE